MTIIFLRSSRIILISKCHRKRLLLALHEKLNVKTILLFNFYRLQIDITLQRPVRSAKTEATDFFLTRPQSKNHLHGHQYRKASRQAVGAQPVMGAAMMKWADEAALTPVLSWHLSLTGRQARLREQGATAPSLESSDTTTRNPWRYPLGAGVEVNAISEDWGVVTDFLVGGRIVSSVANLSPKMP